MQVKSDLKLFIRLFPIVGLLFLANTSFSQQTFSVTYWKTMRLDKSVRPENGMGYYVNGEIQRGGGKIVVTDKYFSITFKSSFGDPDIKAYYDRVEKSEDKTTYYSGGSQLLIFESTISGFNKEQQIQYTIDFDQTLQLFSTKYVFQTITELSGKEQKAAEDEFQKKQTTQLSKEKEQVKQAIAENRVFDGEELSSCSNFIGNPNDLLTFYKQTPENRFSLSLTIDEKGNVSYRDDKRYTKPTRFDTVFLNKVLKFTPAKKIVDGETFFVKSAITLSFMERNGDGIHFTPLSASNGTVKKKSNSVQIASIDQVDQKQILNETLLRDTSFASKKSGIYQFKARTLKLNVDIFIYDKQGRYCYSAITKKDEVTKNIFEFWGQNEIWESTY